jgi:hypothetical protein
LKLKRKFKLAGAERDLFDRMGDANQKKEYGGLMDVNKKGNLERFTTEIGGDADSVEIPDYEVLWHTHPDVEQNPPSPEDIATLLKNKAQQAEVVFNNGRVFTVMKTPLTRKYEKMSEKNLVNMFEKVFNKSFEMPDRITKSRGELATEGVYERYANSLRKMGFFVKFDRDKGGEIEIPVKAVD